MLIPAALVVAGLLLLVWGGEWLVRGAAGLAERLGVPHVVVGLTIVAIGTSMPELFVSLDAALTGSPDVAVGNVIGSNIFNVLFILGASALITPLAVGRRMVRFDVPFMIAASLGTWALAADGQLGRLDGLILLAAIALYLWRTVRSAKAHNPPAPAPAPAPALAPAPAPASAEPAPPPQPHAPYWRLTLYVLAGLVICAAGSRLLVSGAVGLARGLGVPELVTGLTIVAAGTSLPEVAASIVAALRGQRDIAVGNIVGSNIFNLLGIAGTVSAVVPSGLPVSPQVLTEDLPVMCGVAVLCLPLFYTGSEIRRWEGLLFLSLYALYTLLLVLKAMAHPARELIADVTLLGVVPAVALVAGLTSFLAWRRDRTRLARPA